MSRQHRLGLSPGFGLSFGLGTGHLRRTTIGLVAMVACASPPPPRLLVFQVSNELGRAIGEIHMKPCGDLELAFVPIEGSDMAPGESRGLLLPPTCVDLVAYDLRGRVVGEQRGLRMLPDASWVLRR